jgi:hypothetical protein
VSNIETDAKPFGCPKSSRCCANAKLMSNSLADY